MSSRLFQKIREERGLAYSVYTYLTRFTNCGLLSVYVGTTKEDYKEVIKLIKEEFKNIIPKLTKKEMEQATEKAFKTYHEYRETVRQEGSRVLKFAEENMHASLPGSLSAKEKIEGNPFELENVTVQYGEQKIIDNLTWTVKPQQHWWIKGPNGAGIDYHGRSSASLRK